MFKKSPQTKARLLTPDAPDMPASFTVIENNDIFDGCDAVRAEFAFAQTQLVVWHNPPCFGDPMSENQKEAGAQKVKMQDLAGRILAPFEVRHAMKEGVRDFFDPSHDYLETGLRAHFRDIAAQAGWPEAEYDLWRNDTFNLAGEMEECFNTKRITLTTLFQTAAHSGAGGVYAPQVLRSDSLWAVRMLTGDSLRFYAEADVIRRPFHRGLGTVSVKDGAQAWAVQPWDIAFISQKSVCENPARADEANVQRVMEIFDIKSCEEFVASAQRPLLRPWLRRILNRPDNF